MLYNTPEYAVRFHEGVDRGLEPERAFPFMYSFVPSDNDEWDIDKTTGSPLVDIGPLVAAGRTVQHQIVMQPDYNFKLLWAKYSAYHDNAGSIEWYNNEPGFFLEQGDYQTAIGTPLTRFVRVTMTAYGPNSRVLMGGANLDPLANNQGSRLPIQFSTLQGYDFGFGQLYSPCLLPRQGMVLLELTNTHSTKDLYVAGVLFGMKVRV